jgi:hypothetical protein
MLALVAFALSLPDQTPEIEGAALAIRAAKLGPVASFHIEARDAQGRWRVLGGSISWYAAPRLQTPSPATNDLGDVPALVWTAVRRDGDALVFSADNPAWSGEQRWKIAPEGDRFLVTTVYQDRRDEPRTRGIADAIVFAPGGDLRGAGQMIPDAVRMPRLIDNKNRVTADWDFRSPAAIVRHGADAIAIVPDLERLAEDRPLPAALSAGPLGAAYAVRYGFAPLRRDRGDFSVDPNREARWPGTGFRFAYEVYADADSHPGKLETRIGQRFWERLGKPHMSRALPQTMPFSEFAREAVPAAIRETAPAGWWQSDSSGLAIGGFDRDRGSRAASIPFGLGANALRGAWAIEWWYRHFGSARFDWGRRTNRILQLALTAPDGIPGDDYLTNFGRWQGVGSHSARVHNALWLLRFARDFATAPPPATRFADADMAERRRLVAEIGPRVDAIARAMLGRNDPDQLPSLLAVEAVFLSEWITYRSEERAAGLPALRRLLTRLITSSVEANDYRWTGDPKGARGLEAMTWVLEGLLAGHALDPAPETKAAIMRVAAELALDQSVGLTPRLQAAATFGSFPITSARPGHLAVASGDAGVALMRAAVLARRLDLFERGVAAVRAGFATMNVPLNLRNEILSAPATPFGLGAAGIGDVDALRPRQGFDSAEGRAIASAAMALRDFGGAFELGNEWRAGVDGVRAAERGWESALRVNPFGWTGVRKIEVVREGGQRTPGVEPTQTFAIRRIDPELAGDRLQVLAVPAMVTFGDSPPVFEGTFVTAVGRRLPARLSERGIVAEATRSDFLAGPMRFEGVLDGRPLRFISGTMLVDPVFGFEDWRLPGWRVSGEFPNLVTSSRRRAFGANRFLSTAEDGLGGVDDAAQGVVLSPWFLISKSRIRFSIGGGPRTALELIDRDGQTIYASRPRGDDRLEPRAWNTSALRGQIVRIRVTDAGSGRFERIHVGPIAAAD